MSDEVQIHSQANRGTYYSLQLMHYVAILMEAVLNITVMYTVYAIAMFVFIFSLNYYCNYMLSKAKYSEVSESQSRVDLPPVKQVL